MITENADEIAFRFLVDFNRGDRALVERWCSEADPRWCLTLQLCESFLDEVRKNKRSL